MVPAPVIKIELGPFMEAGPDFTLKSTGSPDEDFGTLIVRVDEGLT